MTFRALNNREELDKAVIAAQASFDELGRRMAELQRLQSGRYSFARIANAASDAEVQAMCVHFNLAEVGTAIDHPDLTYAAPPEKAWVADDRRQA